MEYTNAGDHASRCYGKEDLFEAIKTLRKRLQEGLDDTQAKKVQQNIVDGLGVANIQDLSLLSLLELVTMHDIPQTKVRDPSFMKLEGIGYKTLLDTLVHLMWVVEEKIAAEMKGNKGCILHDGWSRYGRHYVALYASYIMLKKDPNGKEFEVTVLSMLACSTLPFDNTMSKYYSYFINND